MYWQDWSAELREVLELKGSPVGVTFSKEPATNADEVNRVRACKAFQMARDGAVINLTLDNSGCPGGSTYLGLSQFSPEQAETVTEFLVKGEKLFASAGVFNRARKYGELPVGFGKCVVFSPLEKAELEPDLVMFLCNGLQASRLTTLANYEIGLPMEVCISGATCNAAVAIPMVRGKLNISLIDTTSRHMCKYDPAELIVTIPLHQMHGVVRAIDRCSAGRAPIEWPPAMRELMRE